MDQMSVQPLITLRCWGPFGPWENVGLCDLQRKQKESPEW